jgi:hypothetical protein
MSSKPLPSGQAGEPKDADVAPLPAETARLVDALRVNDCEATEPSCRVVWSTDPSSWCSGCLAQAAADALAVQARRLARVEAALRDVLASATPSQAEQPRMS